MESIQFDQRCYKLFQGLQIKLTILATNSVLNGSPTAFLSECGSPREERRSSKYIHVDPKRLKHTRTGKQFKTSY